MPEYLHLAQQLYNSITLGIYQFCNLITQLVYQLLFNSSISASEEMSKNGYLALKHLGDIRLVTIDELEGDEISIGMSVANLNDKSITYSALSYCWGIPPVSIPINIHGSCSGIIEITPSLHTALQHAHSLRGKSLWIDALCINQKDEAEQAIQVAQMSRIYDRATNVLIWLGPAEDNSDLAMNLIHEMSVEKLDELVQEKDRGEAWKALAQLLRRPWFTRRWIIQEIAFARTAELLCGDAFVSWEEFAVAVSLFETQLDEIVELFRALKRKEVRSNLTLEVAKGAALVTVVSGAAVALGALHNSGMMNAMRSAGLSLRSDYEKLGDSLKTYDWQYESPLGQVRGVGAHLLVMNLRRIMRKDPMDGTTQRLCSMEALLSYLPTFEAKIDRDVIFCIVSLASDPLGLEGCYHLKALELYKVAIEAMVAESKSLNIICRPWADSRLLESAPSWFPSLSNRPIILMDRGPYIRVQADNLVGSPERSVYDASHSKTAKVSFNNDKNHFTLRAAGIRVGTIVELTEPATEGLIPQSWVELTDSGFTSYSAASYSMKNMFWRALVADRDEECNPPPPWMSKACEELFIGRCELDTTDLLTRAPDRPGPVAKSKKSIRKALHVSPGASGFWADSRREVEKFMGDSTPTVESSSRMRLFLKRVQAVVWNRRMVRLDNDRLGVVPETTRLGDVVSILYGCDVPVVIREISNGWEMVGEAYVHGVMDGEMMKRPFIDREEIFLLR